MQIFSESVFWETEPKTLTKGLYLKYKKLVQLNERQKKLKMGKMLNRYFTKDFRMANKPMKRCSTSFSHQGNANVNYNEIPLHTHPNG